jgi:enoyl-CoA hydratase/carnithine racemase
MGDLAGTVEKITGAVLQGAPGALAASKGLIEELWCRSVKDDIDNALRHHMAARESAEAKEGVAAFIEKRPPSWARS